MTVDWGDWRAFEGSPGKPLHLVERAVARDYYDYLDAARTFLGE